MKLAFRIVFLILLGVQALHTVRVTRHDLEYVAGLRAYAQDRLEDSLSHFERARARWDGPVLTWEWAGEAALRLYDSRPADEIAEARARDVLRRAWQGYAGAVLRSPAQSWSWSGLADVTMRELERSQQSALGLEEITRRARGTIDARRAIALSAASLAVRLKPSGFQELDVLAQAHDTAGDVETGQRLLMESARMMPAPSFHVWGQGERLRGPVYRAVLAALKEGMARAPSFEQSLLHREIGLFAQAHGDDETALEQLRLAEKTARYPIERHMAASALARALEGLGEGNEAVSAYGRALALGFAPGSDAQLLGSLELRLGRAEEACRHLREALRHDPAREGLREHAATACEQAGETELAESTLREGLNDPKTAGKSATAVLDLYWRTGRRSSALRLATDWQRNNPELTTVPPWIEAHRTLQAGSPSP
jgi:tetratricopeptide (TPR) repeat protein